MNANLGNKDTVGLSTELARLRVILLLPLVLPEDGSANGGSLLLGAGGAGLVGRAFCGALGASLWGNGRISVLTSGFTSGGNGTGRVGIGGIVESPDDGSEILAGAAEEEEDCAALEAIGSGGCALPFCSCFVEGPLVDDVELCCMGTES